MDCQVTLEEQESVVRIGRTDDFLYISTTDSTMITKLRKLLQAEDTEWELIQADNVGMKVKAPKNLISLRTKTTTRKMSDEQKRQASERMKTLHQEGRL